MGRTLELPTITNLYGPSLTDEDTQPAPRRNPVLQEQQEKSQTLDLTSETVAQNISSETPKKMPAPALAPSTPTEPQPDSATSEPALERVTFHIEPHLIKSIRAWAWYQREPIYEYISEAIAMFLKELNSDQVEIAIKGFEDKLREDERKKGRKRREKHYPRYP